MQSIFLINQHKHNFSQYSITVSLTLINMHRLKYEAKFSFLNYYDVFYDFQIIEENNQ